MRPLRVHSVSTLKQRGTIAVRAPDLWTTPFATMRTAQCLNLTRRRLHRFVTFTLHLKCFKTDPTHDKMTRFDSPIQVRRAH